MYWWAIVIWRRLLEPLECRIKVMQGDEQCITAASHLSVPELSMVCLLRLAPARGLLWEACPCCWEPG